jgi:exodeoxyribonuclease VII large subunit
MNDLLDLPDLGGNAPEFSVSEISIGIKRLVETEFDHVRVRGELGRVSKPASGHIYLDLKDDRSVLAGVMWKGTASKLNIIPEEGMEVIVTGRLTTFPGQSKYQIIIEHFAPAGAGALMAMLEKRKKELSAEGIFDKVNKKKIPYLPVHIGVVTSPSGAVIKDIMHRLNDRFPSKVTIWPVVVQGEKCAQEVTDAINGFNKIEDKPDVIIVARGGGSLEDLWGFNEEIVVRASFLSKIPIISAIGHETDTTLIDFVADVRAPTPSAAAEMVVPVKQELLLALSSLENRLQRSLILLFKNKKQRIIDLSRGLPKGEDLFYFQGQKLDFLAEKLPIALKGLSQKLRLKIVSISAKINIKVLEQSIFHNKTEVRSIEKQLQRMMLNSLEQFGQKLKSIERLRHNLGYRETLKRGYVVLRDIKGPLTSVEKTSNSDGPITAEFFDGSLLLQKGAVRKTKTKKHDVSKNQRKLL